MPRLNDLNMSTQDIVMALAEGNPGAINVLMQIMTLSMTERSQDILASLLTIDREELYGSKLWVLYKDQCGEDIEATIQALKAMNS